MNTDSREKRRTRQHRIRALLELCGLSVLILLVILSRKQVGDAFASLRTTDAKIIAIVFALAWLPFLITTFNMGILLRLPRKRVTHRGLLFAQIAGSGAGRILPGSLGHIGLQTLYLRSCGLPTSVAALSATLNNVLGVAAHIILLIPFFLLSAESRPIILGTLVLSAIAVASFLILYRLFVPQLKRKHGTIVRSLKNSGRTYATVITTSMGITIINTLMLWLAAQALGTPIAFTYAFIALSAGVGIGSVLPTPGGIGGAEAGVTAALVLLGTPAEEALTIAVIYRLATYWQPLLPGIAMYVYMKRRRLI